MKTHGNGSIINDLLMTSDHGTVLDFSCSFDTIDHSILLHRLEHIIRIKGTALGWFKSYLSDRFHFIHIN